MEMNYLHIWSTSPCTLWLLNWTMVVLKCPRRDITLTPYSHMFHGQAVVIFLNVPIGLFRINVFFQNALTDVYKILEHVCKSHMLWKLLLGHLWKHHAYSPVVHSLECTQVVYEHMSLFWPLPHFMGFHLVWRQNRYTNSLVIRVYCMTLNW